MKMPYDRPPDPAKIDPGHPGKGESWETRCRRLIQLIAIISFVLLVALPLIDYLRYGIFPRWVTEDVYDLPWGPGSKGLLWGAWTLLSTLLLLMTGLVAFFYYVTVAKLSPLYGQHRLFWLLSGLGFMWLAGDEFFGFHEHIGWWLGQVGIPRPPIGKLDDLMNPGLPVIGGVIAYIALKKALTPHKNRFPFLAASVALLVISTLIDLLRPEGHRLGKLIEDGTKILAITGLFLFYLAAFLDAIGHLFQSAKPAPSPLEKHETRGIQQGHPQ